jgi:hypothetical protein
MAAVSGSRRRTGRRAAARRSAPFAYLLVAMAGAVLILPSALRPPPDPATESGAISPDAPPDQNAEQVLISQQQASGGGAGATAGAGAATTTTLPPASAPTTLASRATSAGCFGKPPRQSASVYSAPCVPGFTGDNGGATGHNVFPNEVRLGFLHVLSTPTDGRTNPIAGPNETPVDRTMRVLEVYMNKHFETYGRHVSFYGLPATQSGADDSAAAAQTADKTYHLFGGYDLSAFFAKEAARMGGSWFSDPQQHAFYVQNRPGFYSWQMDFDQAFGFGAEYLCKELKDRPAAFGGNDVNGSPRKIGIVAEYDGTFGIPVQHFVDAYRKECGGVIVDAIEMPGAQEDKAAAAVQRMRLDGVTTIVLQTTLENTFAMMSAATAAYTPEWVLLGNEGLDFNQTANLFPKEQSAHLFGISGWEIAKPTAESECFRAYHEIDPDNDPDATTCTTFWHPMNELFDGIQIAGPHLDAASFQKALFTIGHRYGQAPWAIGGGYGPDDYSYMDSVGEIWFDSGAVNPENGGPGAFHWTFGGARWKRGEGRTDPSQLFKQGVTAAPGT